jgi:uncharacterized protein (TIGR00369 family)
MRAMPKTITLMKLSLSKEYGTPLPFIDHLGIERIQNSEGRALLALEIRPAFRNSWKAAHGGVIMTMLDSAMSLAARLHLKGAPGGILTIEMTAKFIRPGLGARLTAEGRVIGGGRSTLFCEAAVHDEAGTLVAKGMGTLRPLKKKDA